MSDVIVGTKIRITGGRGHYFDVGTEGVVKKVFPDEYYVQGTSPGVDYGQFVERKDFQVIAEGQADGAQVPTKTKGDDTLTKTTETTYEVGQAVRITGASVARLESMLMGEEITTHSLPIGAVTEVLEVCNVDEYVRLSVEGLELTHNHTKEGPQWVRFEHVESATDFWFPVSGSTEDEPVSPPIAEELERLSKETVQELRKGDTVIMVGYENGEDVEDLTIGKTYAITSDFGAETNFTSMVVGGYAGFTDDAGDASNLNRHNCEAFAKYEVVEGDVEEAFEAEKVGPVVLNDETVKELRAGDKVIYVGNGLIEDDEDMTVGGTYEITEGFGEGSDLMTTLMTGGYAGFTDNSGDACAITRGTASGFAKA